MNISDNQAKQDALDLTEASREQVWKSPSVVGELFKGVFRWDLIHPYPVQSEADKAIGDDVLKRLEAVLKATIDPEAVDRDQQVPKAALDALGEAGFFGMKIPQAYGGMGLSVMNYTRAMALVGSYCGSTAVWLSAHQSIGVPQPLTLFGTPEQKERYLPRLAKGEISAFALTEPDVGSDPAKMTTTAVLSEDGTHYILNGTKLYITNGPDASLLVVMANTAPKVVNGREKKQITALIVETNSPGFEVVHRCQFMGIRGIANGELRFTNVKVPVENVIGKPGDGLKIAFVTLNAGRLTIPAISAAAGKVSMVGTLDWAQRRVQWGHPIGEHQAVQQKVANMVADTYAMDSMSTLTAVLADDHHRDIRLEAAMAKYFGSERAWSVADDFLQIRGGRGYETATSLRRRGEVGYPAERMVRDLRINRIIEGTSEVMQLFIAREAMDTHLRFIMPLLNGRLSWRERMGIVGGMIRFYVGWIPMLFVPRWRCWGVTGLSRRNRGYLGWIDRTSRRLAKSLFFTMARYQVKLEKEQVKLATYVDIGTTLFAMASVLSRAEAELKTKRGEEAAALQALVTYYCEESKVNIKRLFRQLGSRSSTRMTVVAKAFFKQRYDWMTGGIVDPRDPQG